MIESIREAFGKIERSFICQDDKLFFLTACSEFIVKCQAYPKIAEFLHEQELLAEDYDESDSSTILPHETDSDSSEYDALCAATPDSLVY